MKKIIPYLPQIAVFAIMPVGRTDSPARRGALISKSVYLQMLGQTQFLNIAQISRQRDD